MWKGGNKSPKIADPEHPAMDADGCPAGLKGDSTVLNITILSLIPCHDARAGDTTK
jgi:hypothetical protein